MHCNIPDIVPAPSSARAAVARGVAKALLIAVCAIHALLPQVSHAQTPELSLPVDCVLGETCWLVNFVDHDPGPGASDFRCGSLTYDTHKGTDIAIADDAVMRRGVDVLAAAPGRVRGVRDGMPNSTAADLQSGTALRGRDCGNGVIIDHGDGWSTQYCHMQAGSVRVRSGDRVGRGDVIGRIGRSGRSEFPHIHMTLRRQDTVIDPFTGTTNAAACAVDGNVAGYWTDRVGRALAYPGPQPFHLGFATGRPRKADIEAGRLDETVFSPDIGALVFWAEAFSLKKDDTIHLKLTGPAGELIADNRVVVDRPLAKWHGFSGRKRPGDAWAVGTYTGTIEITRDRDSVTRSVTAVVAE